MINLTGKKIMVTGASSGIGQAAAILISRLGGRVVLNGRNEARLADTVSQMEGSGHLIMPFDLENLEGIRNYVNDCIKMDGIRFDGLVFSTGVGRTMPIRNEKLTNLHQMMKVSYLTYFMLIKEFASRKILNDRGSIVAVSSKSALQPEKGQASYGSGKAAVNICSEVAAQEFSSRKIRVNTVNPYMTMTHMTKDYFNNPEVIMKQDSLYPLGIIKPTDVAELIVFLLSDVSSKITGQHIGISAGNFAGCI